MDMGIDPFLIAASVKLVIAQRLVRQLCDECRKPMHPPFEHCSLTLNERHQLNMTDPLYHENGCPVCRETGYTGRCGLFEVFHVDEETSEHIHKGLGLNEIKNLAEEKGLRSLREQGIKKVSVGITSISEVIRETAI
jgi:type II secretory ATPase GspE/PulE/Tfp pilus assembly ATPase PilB-like protein